MKRFISRRGRPSDLYSDHGTNFVGANNELKKLFELLNNVKHNEKITKTLVEEGITWHFLPQKASHFGGIWEAATKSTKYHLNRIVGNVRLTYEEMSTVLCQIEACLNSRPLVPLSSDPSDYGVLTPGHFLIGCALNTIPEPDITDVKLNRLNRWQHVETLCQHFWKR